MKNKIFNDLFVLEIANNHWGSVKRGLEIIKQHSKIVKNNRIKAAFKLQIRDVDNFIHSEFKGNKNIRYINKTEKTKLSLNEFKILIKQIKKNKHITCATPFDEPSVNICKELDISIIKIASSDISDYTLIHEILKLKKPTIVSTGGAQLSDIDFISKQFEKQNIPLAINHCVSLYPSEDSELNLQEISFLKKRYPRNVIGLSTHEYTDWEKSLCISYGLGARTFERHVDIKNSKYGVSKYCSLPNQVDVWLKCFCKIKEMMKENNDDIRRKISKLEKEYLKKLLRGFYAKRDLPKNYIFKMKNLNKDFYLSIPLVRSQVSSNDYIFGVKLNSKILKDSPITRKIIDLKKKIRNY